MWQQWSASCLSILADAAIKGTVVLLLAWLLVLCMRRISAAPRHAVWLVAMICLLLLPILSTVLPGWQVLPAWCNLAAETSTILPAEAPPKVPEIGADSAADRPIHASGSAASTPDDPKGSPIADRTAPVPPVLDPPVAEPPIATLGGDWPASRPSPDPATSAVPGPATASTLEPAPAAERSDRGLLRMLLPWIAGIWAAGMAAVAAMVLLAWLSLWWMERHARRIEDGRSVELLEEAARELGMGRDVLLLESPRCSVPLAAGVLRPRLILPSEFFSWSAERRRVVVLHELGHVKRCDCLTKIVAQAACGLYWFNPLVWLVLRWIQTEAERACDDLVLSRHCDPCDYAEHLLQIAAGRRKGRLAAAAGFAMARPSKLEGRLLAILDPRRSRRGLTLLGALVIAAAIASMAVVIATIRASEATVEDGAAATDQTLKVFYRCRMVVEETVPGEERKRVKEEVGEWISVEAESNAACSTLVRVNDSMVATVRATPGRDSAGKVRLEDLCVTCAAAELNGWLPNLAKYVSAVQAGGTVSTKVSEWGADLTTDEIPDASTSPRWLAVRAWTHENKSNGYQGKVVVWLDARVVSQAVGKVALPRVQVQLRTEKRTWRVGEIPVLTTEVRKGDEKIAFGWGDAVCELEFDGQWHYLGVDDHPVDRITLEMWNHKKTNRKLPLSPGKHTVRVAITGPVDGKSVRAVSNSVEITIEAPKSGTDGAKKRVPTISELVAARPTPDLDRLAERSKPGYEGPDATESFYDVLKLRQVGDAKAVPVLEQIVADNLESGRIHGFAAAQALFCIGTREAHQVLSKHLLTGQYRAGQAIGYTFHWEMTEPQRSRFIEQYLLKNVSEDLVVELQQRPSPEESEGRLDFLVTLRNASDRPFHVINRKVYLGKMLFFRTPDGKAARAGMMTGFYHDGNVSVDYERGPDEWIEMKPGQTHQYPITVHVKPAGEIRARDRSVSKDSTVLLETQDVRWDIGKPGRYDVVAMFEAAPPTEAQKRQVEFDNAWSGRAVSKPIQVNIPQPVRPRTDATPAAATSPESIWSEPLKGLRVRVTAPEAAEYRKGQPLPLTVEMQNVSEEPIPYKGLFPHGRIQVTDSHGEWLGAPWFETAVSPWEGRSDSLAPQAILKWQVPFDRLRLTKPVTPGTTVHFQYSVPTQVEEPGKLPRTSYSPPVAIKLKDVPPAPLGPDDLPDRWTAEMDVVYREFAGLGGPERRVHVDGRGHVTLVDCAGFGRIETVLPQKRLDALAARLRRMKIWELSKLTPGPGPLDAGEIRMSLASGGASLVGYYSLPLTDKEPVLAAFQQEMKALIGAALDAAETAKSEAAQGKAALFETFSVEMITNHSSVRSRTTVKADGKHTFHLEIGDDQYDTTYGLRPEELSRLEELLEATKWLTAPAVNTLNLRDGEKYVMSIVRDGKKVDVVCYGEQPKAYTDLTRFLRQIYRQGELLYKLSPRGEDRPFWL